MADTLSLARCASIAVLANPCLIFAGMASRL
jgi:hypothetical protein